MKKRILSLFALVLALSLVPAPAYAAGGEAAAAANALHELGLFNGTGTDAAGNPVFELDRAPTRNEAITMLVRLLGKEAEAASREWSAPFTDVAAWAKPYVGCAYANGLTDGTSATTYGGEENATASQYITFVLRALGYASGSDFQWDKAWELSDTLGLTSGQYHAGTTNFTRGDVAIISCNALSMNLKGRDATLLDDLTARGVLGERTAPNTPDIAEDGHIHNWVTTHYEALGYYASTGFHKVQFNRCKRCGFEVTSDTPDANTVWRNHTRECESNWLSGYKDVPNEGDGEWVEVAPAHDETHCSICGRGK